MKKQVKNRILQLIIIIGCLFLSSACVLMVPIAHNQKALTMLCSIMFWGFLLAGYLMFWFINHSRKKQKQKLTKRRVGIVTFFRNSPAKLMDCICIVGIILLLISAKAELLQGYLQYIISFLVLFSFHMHCILNGENFQYIQNEIRSCLK